MIDGETRSIEKFSTPFGKEVELQDVFLDNDVRLLRVRIREGNRFTILELDPVTARLWGELLVSWSSNDAMTEQAGL